MKKHQTLVRWLAEIFLSAGLAFTTVPVHAQSAPAAAPAPAAASPESAGDQDQVIKMSQFVVRTTQGLGYIDANAATALKGNQALLDIPQGVFVMTNDLITDIGYTRLSDILAFAGVSDFFRGESEMIRGSRASYPYIDDMLDNVPYEDAVFVDSIEVVKGPSAVFYPNASLTGIILKSSKKPLPKVQNLVSIEVNQFGFTRATADFTGPIGKTGDVKWSYRLVGAWQGGNAYFANERDDITAIHPSLELDYKDTSVLIAWDFQNLYDQPGGYGLLTPTGDLFLGLGRKYSGGWVPNMMEHQERRGTRFILDQKLSDNWEMKFAAEEWSFQRYGGIVGSSVINYLANTRTFTSRQNNEYYVDGSVQTDFTGKFYTGIIKNLSASGFNHTDLTDTSKFWTTSTPNTWTIPLYSVDAFEAQYVPQQDKGDYPVPANPGSRVKTYRDNVYYQHQLDVIPDRLSLVAGWTFAQIETVSDTNIAYNAPYAASDLTSHTILHRYGVVGHITKDISVYALDSTTFTPGTGVLFNNERVPNVAGKGDEVGLKTSLLDGRVTSTISAFKMTLTNQLVIGPGLNPFGLGYYIPIGSTTTRGWDGNFAISLVPGWQIIGTAFNGSVEDQTGSPVSSTYENSWSLFNRYDFPKDSPLKGLGIGGGIIRIGARWITTGNTVFPVGYNKPSVIKIHEGTPISLFGAYDVNKHLQLRLNVTNLLDQQYAVGAQSYGNADPEPPRTFSLTVTFSF